MGKKKRTPVSTILFLLVELHSEPAVSCQKITTARPHLSSISGCKKSTDDESGDKAITELTI